MWICYQNKRLVGAKERQFEPGFSHNVRERIHLLHLPFILQISLASLEVCFQLVWSSGCFCFLTRLTSSTSLIKNMLLPIGSIDRLDQKNPEISLSSFPDFSDSTTSKCDDKQELSWLIVIVKLQLLIFHPKDTHCKKGFWRVVNTTHANHLNFTESILVSKWNI